MFPSTASRCGSWPTRHRSPATSSASNPHTGPELVDGTIAAQTLLGHDATGVRAAINALTTIAHRTNTVLAEQTRLLHAHRPAPASPAPACAADPDRIRHWLASPSTDPGFTDETVADVWDFGTTFTTDPARNAVNLVDQAQQAGVFGIPGHHITLLHVPGDEDIDQDGYLLLIDTPGGQRLCSDWLRVDEIVAARPRRPMAPPSTASPPSRPRSTRSSPCPPRPTADASRPSPPHRGWPARSPHPAPPATTNPPPANRAGPAASHRRHR